MSQDQYGFAKAIAEGTILYSRSITEPKEVGVSDASERDLINLPLPSGILAVPGRELRVRVYGDMLREVGSPDFAMRVYLGKTKVFDGRSANTGSVSRQWFEYEVWILALTPNQQSAWAFHPWEDQGSGVFVIGTDMGDLISGLHAGVGMNEVREDVSGQVTFRLTIQFDSVHATAAVRVLGTKVEVVA